MRVTVVCPTFREGMSYQENVWADKLASAGHDVLILGAARGAQPPPPPHAGNGAPRIQLLPTIFLPRGSFRTRALGPALRAFDPEIILLMGNKRFAHVVWRDPTLGHVPLISFFSENPDMHEFDWRRSGTPLRERTLALAFHTLRGPSIRQCCRRSTLIVGNTPQTAGILLGLFNAAERADIEKKIVDKPLGFDPRFYYYDPPHRASVREELGFGADDVVLCLSSQFRPTKEALLLSLVDGICEVTAADERVRGLIIGFDDSETSAAIGALIDASPVANRIVRQPFADRDRLCALYNAGDIALFGQASISCQQALGTGIYVCFADDGAMDHLVSAPDQGIFYRRRDRADLAARLREAAETVASHAGEAREAFRHRLVDSSAWLGYDRIIASTLEQAGLTDTDVAEHPAV